MRMGKINWVKHSNLPILSVDVQPNGYRFVTGGGDGYVCVWNLMPVISTFPSNLSFTSKSKY